MTSCCANNVSTTVLYTSCSGSVQPSLNCGFFKLILTAMQNVRYFHFDTKSGQCVHIWTIVRVLTFVRKAFTMAAHVSYVLKFGCMGWVHRWLKLPIYKLQSHSSRRKRGISSGSSAHACSTQVIRRLIGYSSIAVNFVSALISYIHFHIQTRRLEA